MSRSDAAGQPTTIFTVCETAPGSAVRPNDGAGDGAIGLLLTGTVQSSDWADTGWTMRRLGR